MTTCPVSKIEYQQPCPVKTCPFWLSKPEDNCLRRIANEEDIVSYLSRENKSTLKSVRQERDGQVEQLLAVARTFSNATRVKSHETCPDCGYIRPCSSKSLCGEREKFSTIVCEALDHAVSDQELWRLLAARVPFLEPDLQLEAETLVSQRDIVTVTVDRP